MARTGRPKSTTPRISSRIGLLVAHHRIFESLEHDFFTGKRTYGARNNHIDQALTEYFQKYYPDLLKKETEQGHD